MPTAKLRAVAAALFLASFGLILFELLLTRLFGVVLFAQFAHLALALALLGIGIGAVLQHLAPSLVPDEGLEDRLGWIVSAQGIATLVAVACVLWFPLVEQSAVPPGGYEERSSIKDQLLDLRWFAALLPIIALPFVAGGLAFAGVFQRRRAHIGFLYGADLVGGAVGAVLFLPLLGTLAGPDLVFVVLVATFGAAAMLWLRSTPRAVAAAAVALCAALLAIRSGLGHEVLRVRYAAGFAEEQVVYSKWTPLARLSISEQGDNGTYLLLDNSSASEIFLNQARFDRTAGFGNRSLVYQLMEPPGRVAVLAASAGPEVAVAQSYGFQDIDAIDIAGEIFDLVAERFPDSPFNPYVHGNVRRIKSDGRAAILHSSERYDIIQMVYANLWSSAGLLSNAWSPALLDTSEAFTTYLDKLTPDGTISFARGPATAQDVRAAADALHRRGVKQPWRCIFYGTGDSSVMLLKPRPFTQDERDRLIDAFLTKHAKSKVILDPGVEPDAATKKRLFKSAIMTDDRPYIDDVNTLRSQLNIGKKSDAESALATLYRSILVQFAFVGLAGAIFLGVPFLRRGPTEIRGVQGVGTILGYVACLGYGYLAVETILIHELVLFVGHPTYAVTVVVLAMLLSSGLGSLVSARITNPARVLPLVLLAGIALGAAQAFLVPAFLKAFFLGLPVVVRLAITFVVLMPLGFVLGFPFPLAMTLLPTRAGGVVPWAWALNGWMSVLASMVTVVVSRLFGYSRAFALALIAYAIAAALARRLARSTFADRQG
jgi:hypothetical protein